MMLFTTGLLVGRAYALAHTQRARPDDAVAELLQLAGGDVAALIAAEERVGRFTVGVDADDAGLLAQRLLATAIERIRPLGGVERCARQPALAGAGISA